MTAFVSNLTPSEHRLVEEVGYEPAAIVSGSSVLHVLPPVPHPYSSAEMYRMSDLLVGARRSMLRRLRQSAERSRAAGVVGLRLQVDDFDEHRRLVHLVAVGTAVTRKGPPPDRAPAFFSCNLDGQDFHLLVRAGWLPASVVLGCSVCRVGRQRPVRWSLDRPRSGEMTEATTVLYAAREMAMERLQRAARDDGADGVVGVTITERSHVWGSHILELLVVGTSIIRVDPHAAPIHPDYVFGLSGGDQPTVDGRHGTAK